MTPLVHETATVHPSARLAPGAVVGAHALIGADCVLEPFAVVGPHTQLGPRCRVHSFAVVGGPAQARGTDPDGPERLICGGDNVFREGSTVSRGTAAGETQLGDHNLLMAQSHVGHDARMGSRITLANNALLAGHVTVEDGVIVGGHAAVHQFCRLGTLCFVAANAMVSQDVAPYSMVAGDRARVVGLNSTGLRRAGFDAEARLAIKRALKGLMQSKTRAAHIEQLLQAEAPFLRALGAFFQSSHRGIARPKRSAPARRESGES